MVAVLWDGNGEDAGVPRLWSWTGTVWYVMHVEFCCFLAVLLSFMILITAVQSAKGILCINVVDNRLHVCVVDWCDGSAPFLGLCKLLIMRPYVSTEWLLFLLLDWFS
jgi:hypothetical protein